MECPKINVTAYRKISGTRVLYEGFLYISESIDSPLEEHSDRVTEEGFFENLEDIADAISEAVIERTRSDELRSWEVFSFTSKTNLGFSIYDGEGYIDSSGAYVHEALGKEEIEELIELVDKRIRPKIFQR